jgi:hypothetical protein
MKRYAVVGLVLSTLLLPALAIVLYLILEERGLLPAGWLAFDLGHLAVAWDQAGEFVGRLLDASGRAGQTGYPGGVIGGTGAAGAAEATPPKSHLHKALEEWWDEVDKEHIEPWRETWKDFKEDVSDSADAVSDWWDELWGDEGGEKSK